MLSRIGYRVATAAAGTVTSTGVLVRGWGTRSQTQFSMQVGGGSQMIVFMPTVMRKALRNPMLDMRRHVRHRTFITICPA